MSGEEEGVLSRWSRLKREQARTDKDAGEVPPPDQAHGAEEEPGSSDPSVARPAGGEEDRVLTEEDLPDIESLTYESDFSAFLQKNVPTHLHKMALRKLWASNPLLANLDGLNDYDLDYTIDEVKAIAAQSAEDLARGSKRLNVSDLRAREREARGLARDRRHAGVSPPASSSSVRTAQGESAENDDGGAADRTVPAKAGRRRTDA